MGGKMVYNLRFIGWDLDLRTRLTIHRFSQDKPDIVCVWMVWPSLEYIQGEKKGVTDSNIERS